MYMPGYPAQFGNWGGGPPTNPTQYGSWGQNPAAPQNPPIMAMAQSAAAAQNTAYPYAAIQAAQAAQAAATTAPPQYPNSNPQYWPSVPGAPTTGNPQPAGYPMPYYYPPPGMVQPAWDWNQWLQWDAETVAKAGQFNQALLPWIEQAGEWAKYQQDYAENVRRYGQEWAAKMEQDKWAREMAERQQTVGEEQWGSEFGLKERQQADLQAWREAEQQLRREQTQSQLEGQAIQAWGRRYRPNVRYM